MAAKIHNSFCVAHDSDSLLDGSIHHIVRGRHAALLPDVACLKGEQDWFEKMGSEQYQSVNHGRTRFCILARM
jgi:hypothetical protein